MSTIPPYNEPVCEICHDSTPMPGRTICKDCRDEAISDETDSD